MGTTLAWKASGIWLKSLLLVCLAAGCTPTSDPDARDKALISFGNALFHDTRLSIDGRQSCAGCHEPARFLSDGRPTSVGANGAIGTRNAPSLLDLPLMSTFFWDGRESRLENVVLQPFTNPVEMALPDQVTLVTRIRENPSHRSLIKQAFGRDTINESDVAAALTAYLRTFKPVPTRYDAHVASSPGHGLREDEINGLALFKGKAGCAECHQLTGSPASFTDNRFHHTGIGFEKVAGNINEMVQRLDQLKRDERPIGEAILADGRVAELGRFATTRRSADLGAFRTPSLRNVAETAPYMHDGSVSTLAEAVEREIYYRSLAHGKPISLTVDERRDLIAFLHALSLSEPGRQQPNPR